MHTARTTAGNALAISYDAVTNTVHFKEHDWFADPVRSSGATVIAQATRRPTPATVIRRRRQWLRTGRAA
jgi:hypothetical protein